MAKRTEGFDEAILYYAKKEFLEKGYEDASLRTIAKNASVSTSTIYTRYGDKEGLFRTLVEPAAKKILAYMEQYMGNFEELSAEEKVEYREEYSDRGFAGFMDLLYEYYDEFRLITTSATNGLYRSYLEKAVELDVKCTKNFLMASGSTAYKEGRITDGFIHVVSSAFYSGVFEVVVHDMKREEAERYVTELKNFYNNGWKEYL